MRKLRWFAIIFIVLLTAWATRELFPRRVTGGPEIVINPIAREGPPPRLELSFKNTDVLDLLEARKSTIDKLRSQVGKLTNQLTTRQELAPDTVIIYKTSIPTSAFKRLIWHFKFDKELLEVDIVDLTDSLATFSTWKRGIKNAHEVWAMQESDLPPQSWIRVDEKRNIMDYNWINLGYSYQEGAYIDFANIRVFGLHIKGRAVEQGIGGEVWFKAF